MWTLVHYCCIKGKQPTHTLYSCLCLETSMVYSIIILVSLLAYGFAAPQYGGEHEYHQHHQVELHTTPIPILSHKSERHKEGYQFSFKTGNGIQAEEAGYIKKGEKEDDDVVVMHGSVAYTGPDGVPVRLSYVADEHGFQPQGAHLPTPVPLPPELAHAYEQALQHHETALQHQEDAPQHEVYEEEYQGHYQ